MSTEQPKLLFISRQADFISAVDLIALPSSISASGRFGVMRVALGIKSRMRDSSPSGSSSSAPAEARMTGSITRSNSGFPSKKSATTPTIEALPSIPVFAPRTGKSDLTRLSCDSNKVGSVSVIPFTEPGDSETSAVTAFTP